MNKLLAAALAGGAVLAAQLSGRRWSPTPDHPRTAAWYASLRKPGFTPPGPVFAVAWTGLDVLQAYAGTRLLTAPSGSRRNVALALWTANVLGIAGFTYVLFGRRRLDQAAEVTAGMLLTSLGAVAASSRVDARAARAGVPLAAWIGFATLLQEEVWRRNT